MYLKELQENWNTFGEEDPLWAIYAAPDKKGNRWDPKEFFETGANSVASLVGWMERNGYPEQQGTALDFGCGVGRLTQALCDHFDWCVGVDIAPSMIAKAKEYNRHGKNCTYRVNESDDLDAFRDSTFDLVYTEQVLQHIRPEVALGYISEFVRILKPGGLAYFHCPSKPPTYAYPPEGIACRLETTAESMTLEHGQTGLLSVRATNIGNHPIGANTDLNAPAKAIHHWVEVHTGKVFPNHGYLNFPAGVIVAPGETIEFEYPVASPAEPGAYALVLTPATYFNEPISQVPENMINIPAQVLPATENEAASGDSLGAVGKKRPKSESHTIPVDAVEAAVKRAGGHMVDVRTLQAGPGALCTSYYYVSRQ